jgi:DMSO/TMAO reductase YedYZ heme-binding membrane subunit
MWYADKRFAVVGVGLVALALLPLLARHAGLGWEVGSVAGLLAALGALALCAFPVRPREATPPAPTPLDRHRDLGFAVIALSVVHATVLVVADHPAIEYLMPTMPIYQAAGILAFLALLVLGATSTQGQRRRLWHSHRGFQAFHVVLSIAAIVLITLHVVVSSRYVHGRLAAGAYVAVTMAALAMLLRERKGARTTVAGHGIVGRAAFGRHSALVVAVTLAACVGMPLLLPGSVGIALRAGELPRSQSLPLAFEHEQHRAVNCLVCHHNFVDKSGPGACISCHRSSRRDIKVAIEPRFHSFCFDCHRDPGQPFKKHGPAAGCEPCHQHAHPAPD